MADATAWGCIFLMLVMACGFALMPLAFVVWIIRAAFAH